MPKNKVKYNLSNVYWALLTISSAGEISFGTPQPLPGAVSLSLEANGEPSIFYADGYAFFTVSNNQGYEGDFELAMLTDAFRTGVLKETMDDNNVLIEDSSVQTAQFALLFQFDGDVKKIRHVMYNCTANRPTIESKTKESDIEVQTEKLTITAAPLEGGYVKARTSDDTTSEIYENWFNAVYLPGSLGADVKLSALTLGSVSLTPTFNSDVTDYTATTTSATNTVTATPHDPDAHVVITVNGDSVTSGTAVTWETGENDVEVVVTNGTARKTYRITVTKSGS